MIDGVSFQREEQRYIGRVRDIDEPSGASVVLHQRQPFYVIAIAWRVVGKQMKLSLEPANHALLYPFLVEMAQPNVAVFSCPLQ